MKFRTKILFFVLAGSLAAPSAQAIDINLFNVDINSPESGRLTQAYGDAYGFPAAQVAPAMMGPAEEVPAILQIAQAAGTVPMSVWMMRRMGMSYSRILQNFALGPTALMGSGIAGPALGGYPAPGIVSPRWGYVMDPFMVQTARITYLRDVLRVSPAFIPNIPFRGIDFSRAILYPVHPTYGAWMPPGIAKKYGLWMPPGQAKKYGYSPWGWPNGKGKWVDDDDFGHHDDDDGHGKGDKDKGPSWKSESKNGKGKSQAKADAKDHDKGKGSGKSNGGGKSNGKGKHK